MKKKTLKHPDPFASGTSSWRLMLRLCPLRNPTAARGTQTTRGLPIRRQTVRPRWLVPPLSWIIRPRLEKTVWLDELGTAVWDQCDGKQDVETIIDWFAEDNKLSFHEARTAVTQYLQQLLKLGLVVVTLPESGVDALTVP